MAEYTGSPRQNCTKETNIIPYFDASKVLKAVCFKIVDPKTVSRIDSIVLRINSIVLRINSICAALDSIVRKTDLIVIKINLIDKNRLDFPQNRLGQKNRLNCDKNQLDGPQNRLGQKTGSICATSVPT